MVKLLEEGIIHKILTVQAFDQYAIRSLLKDVNHIEVGAGFYANPHNRGTAVNLLDVVVLGATEIDVHFNVNVNTHSDGILQYPTGGHSDTAAGAKLTIITTPLIRGRIPVVVDDVIVVSTPGESVDVLGDRVRHLRESLPAGFDRADESGKNPPENHRGTTGSGVQHHGQAQQTGVHG